MAHTFRNKNTVPAGWSVRDDGTVYFVDCCPTKLAHRLNFWSTSDGCYCGNHTPSFRRSPYRKESKKYRKTHYRQYRSRVKRAMRRASQFGYEDEHWEDIPQFRRTSGWLTW